jgi:hypothetical protein
MNSSVQNKAESQIGGTTSRIWIADRRERTDRHRRKDYAVSCVLVLVAV